MSAVRNALVILFVVFGVVACSSQPEEQVSVPLRERGSFLEESGVSGTEETVASETDEAVVSESDESHVSETDVSETDDIVEPEPTEEYEVAGYVQKGPFTIGTELQVRELSESLIPNGKVFSATIRDNAGAFAFRGSMTSPFAEFSASGYYFDEVAGALSSGQVTLTNIVDLGETTDMNLNVFTHIARDRVYALVDGGATLADAKAQAQDELVQALGADPSLMEGPLETLSLTSSGYGNGLLLAYSAVLQQGRSVAELTELLAGLSRDFANNGQIDAKALWTNLAVSAKALDSDAVRSNLESRYLDLGMSIDVPAFEAFVLALDDTPPAIEAIYPPDDATDIGPGTPISIRFDDVMDPNTLMRSAFRLVDVATNVEVDATLMVPSSSDNMYVILDPVEPLATGATYEIQVDATLADEAGNLLEQGSVTRFTVVDFPTEGLLFHAPFSNSLDTNAEVSTLPVASNGDITFVTDRFGNENQAAHFGSEDAWVTYTETESVNLDGHTSLTISFWVRFDREPSPGGFYENILLKPSSYALRADGSFRFQCGGEGCTNYRFWGTPTLHGDHETTWMHVSMVMPFDTTLPDRAEDLILGTFWEQPSFLGRIDDLRIYNRELSQAERNALLHEGGWKP